MSGSRVSPARDGKNETERRGTGVSFTDVAGIDKVKNDIQEVLEMMMGEERFGRMGARMPRGILLEGPPGTGKTYLAKAMAGEAGIPFFRHALHHPPCPLALIIA